MEEGNLPVSAGLLWVRGHSEDSGAFAEDIPGTHAVLRTNRLEAWRCRKCFLIAFRYGRPLESKPDFRKSAAPVTEPTQS
jgi:hypothetical protein